MGLPTGTVTFLFTDIEGSTPLAQQFSAEMPTLLARHHAILHQSIAAHHGHVFQIIGDAFCAAFHTASDALQAALDAQRNLQHEAWQPAPIKVRMGLHTGSAQTGAVDAVAGGYAGYATLVRVQRVMSTGHGGQILLSNASTELVRGELPQDVSLQDMGEHRLKGLLNPEHLWQVVVPDLSQDFPPLQSLNAFPNNLPVQLTSFVGREKEIVEIKSELGRHRLVTLTGSGGTGKTRLSLQIGAEFIDHYHDGVWFIELAPLTAPNLIPQTILSILRLGEQPSKTPLKVLEEQLNHKNLLLILDNCEHVIEDCAKVAHALLLSAPEIKILATSREALGVKGEIAWRVQSLALPDLKSLPAIEQLTQYEAVRLFIERALLVQPHFKVDQANAPAIAQICSRLDGIPLAIELAAARLKLLSADQIATRLDDRFRLLTGGARTALPRQQTLRAMVDWSYDLLADNENLLLRRLAVFAGDWSLELAEQVCSDEKIATFEVLNLLGRLVDKSLVAVDEDRLGTRYHILETVRQYAREKLFESGEGETLHNQHLAYFLALAEKCNREITGPQQAEAIDLLDAERDNFRAALEWCVSNRYTESALQLLGAIGWAWDMRGYYHEARSWYDKIRVLDDLANYPKAYARVLCHIGHFASDFDHQPEARALMEESQAIWSILGSAGEQGLADVLLFLGMDSEVNGGNIDEAESLYKKSLELSQRCGNQRMHAGSMMFLGGIEYTRGNITAALNLFKQSLAFAQSTGDLLLISLASGRIGRLFVEQGHYEKARPLIEQLLSINEKLQFRYGLVGAWFVSGDLYRRQGDYYQAEQCFEKSMSASRDLGMKEHTSFILFLLGLLTLHQNDYPSAVLRFRQYFDFARALEEKVCFCRFLTGMSAVAGGTNQPERCAKLFGAAQAIFDTVEYRMWQFDCAEFDRHIQIAREQLGNAKFDAFSNAGCTMTMEQAIELALEQKPTKEAK